MPNLTTKEISHIKLFLLIKDSYIPLHFVNCDQIGHRKILMTSKKATKTKKVLMNHGNT